MSDTSPRGRSAADVEVPEADRLEQAEDLVPEDPAPGPSLGVEVPEADALEQAQEVPLPDDEDL